MGGYNNIAAKLLGLVLGLSLAAWPAVAEDSDPFHEVAPPATSAPGHDPFQMAPEQQVVKPPPLPKPRAAPGPELQAEPVVVAPPPPPAEPAAESFEGKGEVWDVRATLTGRTLKGDIRCYRVSKGNWSNWRPTFVAVVDANRSFNVIASSLKGWDLRRISGTLPQLRVESANMNSALDCPDGTVTLTRK